MALPELFATSLLRSCREGNEVAAVAPEISRVGALEPGGARALARPHSILGIRGRIDDFVG